MRYQKISKAYYYMAFMVVTLFFAHYLGYLQSIEIFLRSLISPWAQKMYSVEISASDFSNSIVQPNETSSSSLACVEERDLRTQLLLVQKENSEMKTQLGYIKSHNFSTILSSVIGKNLDSVEKNVIIDVGSKKGIIIGLPVIAGQGVLVGMVVKVDPDISIVRLVNDSQFKVAALALNNDNSSGIVEGGYGLSLRLKFIPRHEIMVVGDEVVTAGTELGIPKGLSIGNIAVVENEAFKPFQQAVLNPSIDLNKISMVSVIISDL